MAIREKLKPAMMTWHNQRKPINLTRSGVVMGILNATPDSFSDGGSYSHGKAAIERALRMVDEGAEIIDVGGESTRPGADAVGLKEEISRTLPLIKAIRAETDTLISIDTSKPEVAAAAIDEGADIVNDVTGLRDQRMVSVCAESGVGVCVMHMQGEPRSMQKSPRYDHGGGVVATVQAFFRERLETLTSSGIDPSCICFDPGIGFGKTLEHNLELIRHLSELQYDRPLLLGVSRKSFIGQLTGEDDPRERDFATAAITALAYQQGIRLHRVHHVTACLHALRAAESMVS